MLFRKCFAESELESWEGEMSELRRLNQLGAVVLGLLAAASVAAQTITVGGEDVNVFFAVASGEKKVKLVPASNVTPSGQVVIPPGVASGMKQHGHVQVYYRRNKCTHKKEVVIAPEGMTAEQIAEEEKKNGQDCGGWICCPRIFRGEAGPA